MSGSNSSSNRNGSGEGEDEGWGSKLFKVASAAAATAAVAGGLYALLTSSSASQPEVPFQARRVSKEPDHDPWPTSTHHHESSSQNTVWTKPELGWVKLNVDGSRVHEGPFTPASAGCGGVLRDSSGKWLLGFSRKLDPSFDVHETEIRAIFTGLQLAWERGEKKLVVESDLDSAVDLVKNGCKYTHPQFGIISQIRKLLDGEWEVELTKISNKANRVADRLAYKAHGMSDGIHQFLSPPDNYHTLLLEDAQG